MCKWILIAVVSGYYSRVFENCNNYKLWKGDITQNTIANDFIKARCYLKQSLKHPTKSFENINQPLDLQLNWMCNSILTVKFTI